MADPAMWPDLKEKILDGCSLFSSDDPIGKNETVDHKKNIDLIFCQCRRILTLPWDF
jgi:hypothetical protein